MKIIKGTIIIVDHARKGKFEAIAAADFDTATDEWYPVILHQVDPVSGITQEWNEGDIIPCRNSLCSITVK